MESCVHISEGKKIYSEESGNYFKEKVIYITPSEIIPILSELSEFFFFHRYMPWQFQITCFRLLYFILEQGN